MKKAIPKVPLVYPLPVTLIGVQADNGIMITTNHNVTVLGNNPPMIGLLIDDSMDLYGVIEQDNRFSVSMPNTVLIDKADLCATATSPNFDKSKLFDIQYHAEVPYVNDCPSVLICKVISKTKHKKQHVIVAEVKKTLVEETLFVEDKIPALNILDPIIYGPDSKYYNIGNVIGSVSTAGRMLYRNVRKTMKPEPYSFHLKHKICQLKEDGMSYKALSKKFGVYHETIEDWFMLYSIFGKDGLTKKMSNKLANTKFTQLQKETMINHVIEGTKTYRELCEEHMVSLSRLRNWVKKARKEKNAY